MERADQRPQPADRRRSGGGAAPQVVHRPVQALGEPLPVVGEQRLVRPDRSPDAGVHVQVVRRQRERLLDAALDPLVVAAVRVRDRLEVDRRRPQPLGPQPAGQVGAAPGVRQCAVGVPVQQARGDLQVQRRRQAEHAGVDRERPGPLQPAGRAVHQQVHGAELVQRGDPVQRQIVLGGEPLGGGEGVPGRIRVVDPGGPADHLERLAGDRPPALLAGRGERRLPCPLLPSI